MSNARIMVRRICSFSSPLIMPSLRGTSSAISAPSALHVPSSRPWAVRAIVLVHESVRPLHIKSKPDILGVFFRFFAAGWRAAGGRTWLSAPAFFAKPRSTPSAEPTEWRPALCILRCQAHFRMPVEVQPAGHVAGREPAAAAFGGDVHLGRRVARAGPVVGRAKHA